MSSDFTLVDHGSISVITPLSEQATEWVNDYISDDAQWFGNGFVVEHRYVDDIVTRLIELEMTVRPILIEQVIH